LDIAAQDVFSSFSSSAGHRELQQPSWDPGEDTLGASGGLLLPLVRKKLAPKHHFSFLDWTKRAELILSLFMPSQSLTSFYAVKLFESLFKLFAHKTHSTKFFE